MSAQADRPGSQRQRSERQRSGRQGSERQSSERQDSELGDSEPRDSEPAGLSGNRLRLLVAGLVLLEAVLLIGTAVVLLVAAVVSDQDNPAALVALAAIAVIVGGGLALCARGVTQGLRWTRGPVFTWQLLQAGVGMPLSTTNAWWAGVPLLAVSVVVLVLIAGRHVITQSSERF